jgi:Holliday junction resolvase RusA-like endonuclease
VLAFELPGVPIPKQRHRMSRRRGVPFSYDPQDREKKAVRAMLTNLIEVMFETGTREQIQQLGYLAEADGIAANVVFYLPIAESLSRTKKSRLLWTGFHQTKPDVDNLAKFYLDCANGVLWSDDKKIFSLNLKKKYSDKPRTVMYVQGVKNKELDEKTWSIIGSFSPHMLDDLVNSFRDLSPMLQDIHGGCPTDIQIRAKDAARIISRIADTYADELKKVTIKHPNYWKEEC